MRRVHLFISGEVIGVSFRSFIENNAVDHFYNIGSGKPRSLTDIADIILRVANKQVPIIVKKSGMNKQYTCDISRLTQEIGKITYSDFETSIKEMIRYYSSLKDE